MSNVKRNLVAISLAFPVQKGTWNPFGGHQFERHLSLSSSHFVCQRCPRPFFSRAAIHHTCSVSHSPKISLEWVDGKHKAYKLEARGITFRFDLAIR